ncbi:Hypothetical predicted protein [Cloeon dipterum]|uniref:Uncharacterized protein n=1 Tax=Cloeon dipterum TaxID=197152 RepID=A0A8S1CWF5_9INSE|nr:Hypothetical predicted protein [Cloeon dipterum]
MLRVQNIIHNISERLDRRRSRSRSRSPYYERYRRRSRSRSRSYTPPRRYRDDLRREKLPPRRISPEPLRKPVSRQLSPPPPLMRKRESTPPPRKASNPEEAAYLRAIEKQKQERETVLKMKAIKRKLEIEKKKRDGDKPEVASPEKVAPGPSKEPPQKVSPVAEAQPTKILLKPKIKVIKKMEGQEPTRKISLVTSNPTVDEPLVSRVLSKNGEESSVRRIVASKKDLVSSVLRGAEGPSMDQSYSKKIIKKSVVITKPASQAGLSSTSEERVSLVSANHQMRLAVTKTAKQVMASGIVVAIENIPSATTPDTLKKMGMGLGLKAIRMKKLGTHQTAQMVFSTREGAEKFVKQNQRKVLDLSVIDLKIL